MECITAQLPFTREPDIVYIFIYRIMAGHDNDSVQSYALEALAQTVADGAAWQPV